MRSGGLSAHRDHVGSMAYKMLTQRVCLYGGLFAHRYRVQVPSCFVWTGVHAVCDCEGLKAVLCGQEYMQCVIVKV